MKYHPPRWLPGGHMQTIWPVLMVPEPVPIYRREIWPTPDGGEIAVDCLDGRVGQPLLVLFHGLEGSSYSHYAKAMMNEAKRQGWHGRVPHFRGCGGIKNKLPRAYHASDAAEIRWILHRLAAGQPKIFAVGISLGGSMLLHYLANEGTHALPTAAAAISVPLDLIAAQSYLDKGLTWLLYTRRFISALKSKAFQQLTYHPGLFDADKLRATRTFSEFDDLVTAPLHGFNGAMDYWRQSSSQSRLANIACPTLILNSRNDPFYPNTELPPSNEISAAVTLELPAGGGHAGFVTGAFPGQLDWLPKRVLLFFAQ